MANLPTSYCLKPQTVHVVQWWGWCVHDNKAELWWGGGNNSAAGADDPQKKKNLPSEVWSN